jgi:hypothetical protein
MMCCLCCSGPLAHLKLAGQHRLRQPTHLGLAAAAAAAAPAPRRSKAAAKRKRNTMTAAQLGEHIDAAKVWAVASRHSQILTLMAF